MKKIQAMLHRLYRDEEGATAVEYGVLVALIIGACVAIIVILGGAIEKAFNDVSAAINNAT
jgi:pilus assembly protein Flp/PilA